MASCRFIATLSITLAVALSSCGGSGSGNSGGGASAPSISSVEPSNVMVGIPQSSFTILGANFTQQSVVFVDGQQVMESVFVNSSTLQPDIDISIDSVLGAHQFTVQDSAGTSNPVPFTVYAPKPGPVVMNAIPGYLVGQESDSTFISVGDINGDGFADVLMPGPPTNGSPSIAILDGHSDGSLSPPVYVPTLGLYFLQSVVLGDVNGDGNPDLIYITADNATTTSFGVLLGDGHGNFQSSSAPQSLPGVFPGLAALDDVDGDGKPDLVVSLANKSGKGGLLVWLKNDGQGNFAAPITLTATGANLLFSVADFNRDGKPDILYSALNSSTGSDVLHLLLSKGSGHFTDTLPPGLNGMAGPATVIDFNLDGIPDLILQVPQGAIEMYSFSGNGDGSFTQVASMSIGQLGFAEYFLVAGDFDHDGFPDLAGVNGETEPSHIIYLFGDGHGNFTPLEVVGAQGGIAATGDINGDGLPDVIVPDRFNFVSVAVGRTDRNFPLVVPLTPETATSVSVGDINGDGLPEIFIAGDIIDSIPGTVFLNQGNNSFQLAATTDPSTFMIADLTGKGVVDLIGGPGSTLEVWPNNGTLDFSSSPITFQMPSEGPITVADMDGDGHPDIVALGQIFYGNGSYQFTAIPMKDTFPSPYVVGDFKGDGRLDIASGSYTYLNMGNRTFQEVPNTLGISGGALAVVGDFNGDGKDDVAIQLPGDTNISIWYSRGDGTFYEATILDAGQEPGTLAVADFDGDGRPDLAAGLLFSQQVALFFNVGQGRFSRSFFASGADNNAMVASDMNRDGKPDLVIVNFLLDFRPPNVDVVFHK